MRPKSFFLFITIIAIKLVLIVQSCSDESGRINVGWTNNPTCKGIAIKWQHLCESKDIVKTKCAKTCGLCGDESNAVAVCEDKIGKNSRLEINVLMCL